MAIARKPAKTASAPAPNLAPKIATAPDIVAAPEAAAMEVADAVKAGANEVQELIRKSTQQGLEQTRVAYDKMKAAAEEATSAIGSTCTVTMQGFSEISQKSLEAVKAGADAQIDFFKSLMKVKSPTEAITLQTAFMRQQFETLKAQSEDLAATAQKIAKEAAEPLKTTYGKAFSVAA